MNLEDAYYVARGITDRGQEVWSRPMHGLRCSSSNVKRTTVEQLGIFMLEFITDIRYIVKIEVFKMPEVSVLTLESAGGERFSTVNA